MYFVEFDHQGRQREEEVRRNHSNLQEAIALRLDQPWRLLLPQPGMSR